MNTGVAARERDVGVTKNSEGYIAVDEASIHVAELDAVVTGVAVGEPGDVLGAGVVAKWSASCVRVEK